MKSKTDGCVLNIGVHLLLYCKVSILSPLLCPPQHGVCMVYGAVPWAHCGAWWWVSSCTCLVSTTLQPFRAEWRACLLKERGSTWLLASAACHCCSWEEAGALEWCGTERCAWPCCPAGQHSQWPLRGCHWLIRMSAETEGCLLASHLDLGALSGASNLGERVLLLLRSPLTVPRAARSTELSRDAFPFVLPLDQSLCLGYLGPGVVRGRGCLEKPHLGTFWLAWGTSPPLPQPSAAPGLRRGLRRASASRQGPPTAHVPLIAQVGRLKLLIGTKWCNCAFRTLTWL